MVPSPILIVLPSTVMTISSVWSITGSGAITTGPCDNLKATGVMSFPLKSFETA